MTVRSRIGAGLIVFCSVSPATAQNYALDARRVGLGAIGSTKNIASPLVTPRRKYRRIGLPVGLLQMPHIRDLVNPDSDDFDPLRAAEYGANPVNLTFGRDKGGTGKALINDLFDGNLNRNLNVYRGFRPATKLTAEGVGSPSWGKTFELGPRKGEPTGATASAGFQAIYVGAGPYATVTTETLVDQRLSDLLGSPVPTSVPSATMAVTHQTTGQGAAAITGGYRLRVPRVETGPQREGVYFATNVSYLIGFEFDDLGADVRFDTDAAGLLVVNPTTVPADVRWLRARSGRGITIDTGIVVALARWDFGVGVNGIANRLTWREVEEKRWQVQSLLDDSFDELPTRLLADPLRVEIPINISGDAAYYGDRWSATAEYARRFRGNNFQSGLEYRAGTIDLRGGMRFARDRWHPSGGLGINLTPRFGIDAAIFSTSTNVERRRSASIALSLRIESAPRATP